MERLLKRPSLELVSQLLPLGRILYSTLKLALSTPHNPSWKALLRVKRKETCEKISVARANCVLRRQDFSKTQFHASDY